MSVCNVLLIGSHLSNNLGGPSVVLGTMNVLREQLGDCTFVLVGSPWDEATERAMAKRHGIPFVPLPPKDRLSVLSVLPCAVIARILRRPYAGSRRVREFLRAVQAADLVVNSVGIMFADTLGWNAFADRAAEGRYFGVAKILGKPMIKYTSDFGPLEARWNRFFARFWLGHWVDAIVCRTETSYRCLTEIGISSDKLLVAPDTGFLMEPAHTHAVERALTVVGERPRIAIGVSHQIRRQFRTPAEYDSLINSLVHHVACRRGFGVLVIPNELHERADVDDLVIARSVVQDASNPRVALVDSAQLSGPELKAVLGKCDAIVSSRYHSLVAGLSMGVPCLAMGWHHKYHELFRLFNIEEWVLNHSDCDKATLIDAFDRLWDVRESLRKKIGEALPSVEAGIRKTARAVAQRLVSLSHNRIRMRSPEEK
jgi:polysaccharide pyruvyl transferase WcaK-like protein